MSRYVGYIVNDTATNMSPDYDEVLFTNLRAPDYAITSGTISFKENNSAQFQATLPLSNVNIDKITPAKTTVRITEDGTTIFVGVISSCEKDNKGNAQIVAEDFLSALNRIMMRPTTAARTVSQVLDYIVANYSGQGAPLFNTWTLIKGDVNVTGSFVMNPEDEFLTLFDVLKNLVADKGGYIRLRYKGAAVYLDYKKLRDHRAEQAIKFGENLIDISGQINSDTIVTRVYPIGKDGLTIHNIEGRDYLINEVAEAAYGRNDKRIDVDTENASTLKQYGQAYLTRYAAMKSTITLTALDLSTLDANIESFKEGDLVHVISPPQGIDADMPVSEIVIDLVRPANSRLTLGDESSTLTGAVSAASETEPTTYDAGSHFTKLPDGTLVQWAFDDTFYAENTTTVTKDIAFPIPFINTAFNVLVTCRNDASGHYDGSNAYSYNYSATGCTVRVARPTAGFIPNIYWLAVGRWKN